MLSFKSQYNLDNLTVASACLGIPLSHIVFIEFKELCLQDIPWMWTKSTLGDLEAKEGFKFGWGTGKSIDEVCSILEDKYNAKFLRIINDIDPVIVIDGRLYDGWKRSILAYSLGQAQILCATFKSSPISQVYHFAQSEDEIINIRYILKQNSLSFKEEVHDGGIIFYLKTMEDLGLLKKIAPMP